MRSGSSTAQAARIAGVSEMSAVIWVKQAGYVPRTPALAIVEIDGARRPRAPLAFTERCRLEELLEGGCTAVRAAELLDRHRDTIRREIVKGLTGSG
jgi:IS30 family transposase